MRRDEMCSEQQKLTTKIMKYHFPDGYVETASPTTT